MALRKHVRQIVEDSPRCANGFAAAAARVPNDSETWREVRESAIETASRRPACVAREEQTGGRIHEARTFDARLESSQIEVADPSVQALHGQHGLPAQTGV